MVIDTRSVTANSSQSSVPPGALGIGSLSTRAVDGIASANNRSSSEGATSGGQNIVTEHCGG